MRVNAKAVLTPGTPISVGSILGCTGVAAYADRVLIQMPTGGVGIGYILDLEAFPSTAVPAVATAGMLAGQMAPASAGSPGGSYTDFASPRDGAGINLNRLYVDGASADPILVSANRRV
jgi:hypothetical protein